MTNKENPYVLTNEAVIVDTYRHADDSLSFASKVKTAVRVTHKITGIQVTCSSEVSVQRNKEKAMEELANKLAELGGDAESLPKQPKKATVLAYRVCGWHNSLHHTKNHALHHVKQMYSGDEAVVIQQLMDVGEHELIMDRLRGQYDALREERDAALARVTELESKIADTQAYKQHPQIVGYARKKELAPLLDPCQPDGSYIYIGLDHPACWAEEPPYEFLIPLYAAPVTPALPEDVRVLLSRAQAEIEHLAEYLENVCEDDEELDVAEDIKESVAVAEKIAHLIATAPVSKTAAPVQDESSLPDVCDGKEQDAFEEWATKQGMNMQCHPMHWLFLDTKTISARQGWKAALKYVRAHIAAVSAKAQQRVPDDVETFLDEVRAELLRARSKFPGDRIMTIALAEEFGELCKAVLDEPAANVRKEAVQTAVMAARVVLDGDGSVTAWRSERGLDPLTGATGKEGSNE